MAIKFEKIQPGMILFDRHRYRTGLGAEMGEWAVHVKSVDPQARTAWNGNRAETWVESRLVRLYAARKVGGKP